MWNIYVFNISIYLLLPTQNIFTLVDRTQIGTYIIHIYLFELILLYVIFNNNVLPILLLLFRYFLYWKKYFTFSSIRYFVIIPTPKQLCKKPFFLCWISYIPRLILIYKWWNVCKFAGTLYLSTIFIICSLQL